MSDYKQFSSKRLLWIVVRLERKVSILEEAVRAAPSSKEKDKESGATPRAMMKAFSNKKGLCVSVLVPK
tara:strand:+ start:637 stop:843 length:207 start_codon:yes stop_codon:yes gene_type:complete